MFRIDQQQVTGSHTHVHRDTVHIREIDVTHHVDRLVVVGIESEVLEQQTGIDDTHRVVVKTHADAVGQTYQIGIFHIELTVYLRMFQRSLDGEVTLGITLETHDLVFYETVDKRQWETGHVEDSIDMSLVLILIVTAQGAEFLIVQHEVGLDGVGVVLFHQIDKLRTEIADDGSLVGHILDGHI